MLYTSSGSIRLYILYFLEMNLLFLTLMQMDKDNYILVENHMVYSAHLDREVVVDFYLPVNVAQPENMSLLLINDGQDLTVMNFKKMLEDLYKSNEITPLLCVGVHCGKDRKNEYATAKILDYKGYGTKAAAYTNFIFKELLPYIKYTFSIPSFREKSFCGFSLGGLSAIDIVWNHPEEFTKVGVFSGSLWWRTVSQNDKSFDEEKHRIMHMQIREGGFYAWLKFFFQTGALDEVADRNKNGVIDSIDDTVSLIHELVLKGYDMSEDIKYLELTDGLHNVPTWGRSFPIFLKWGWGTNVTKKSNYTGAYL